MFSKFREYIIIGIRLIYNLNKVGGFSIQMKKLKLKNMIFCILAILLIMGVGSKEAYATQSRDNSLKELSISAGTLTPEFYYSTTRYTAVVPGDIESIEVTAIPNHPAARVVSITGADNLSVGENIILIEVEAQDGTPVVYQITVTREEPEETSEPERTTEAASSEATRETVKLTVNETTSSKSKQDSSKEKEVDSEDNQASKDEINKLKNELTSLKRKYDKDVRVLFIIIVILALIGTVILVLLLGMASRNRGLNDELKSLQLRAGIDQGLDTKKGAGKEKANDSEGDYYFEEIDD